MSTDTDTAPPVPTETKESRLALGRKFWFCVGLQVCAMVARYYGWVDGAQLVAWSTFNAATYAGGNIGARLVDGVVGWLGRRA